LLLSSIETKSAQGYYDYVIKIFQKHGLKPFKWVAYVSLIAVFSSFQLPASKLTAKGCHEVQMEHSEQMPMNSQASNMVHQEACDMSDGCEMMCWLCSTHFLIGSDAFAFFFSKTPSEKAPEIFLFDDYSTGLLRPPTA
jgi:hypothetical protein